MKRVGFSLAAVVALAWLWACSTESEAPPAAPDAAPRPTSPPVPSSSSDGAISLADAAAPTDAALPTDAATLADAPADAPTDAGPPDAGDDASDAAAPPIPVALGADNVLRGHVHGTFTHDWRGVIRLSPSAPACPAPAPAGTPITVSNGARCCVWRGAFAATSVANIPVELDLTTRAGTLAGSPMGVYSGPPPDASGAFRHTVSPSTFHLTNGWKATEAIGDLIGESSALVAESRDYFTLIASGAMREVLISLSSAEVQWNPTAGTFRIRDTHQVTPGTAGTCGAETAAATASFLLTSP